ncbi:Rv2231c family pyridoxal phosphate-dependent protein CobC [Streptomyces sp. NPDC020742]|uniref:Rv2231c family pyridoxal phosphate-dependent protein CobC n=1 Tax=Streptomyces sp. NPDC020742 TaxID=3154897 RepID=UPI0033DEC094
MPAPTDAVRGVRPGLDAPVPEPDLRHHGDAEVRDADGALTDLAVNVRTGTPPAWLKERIAASLDSLAAYPDGRAARRAVAARHDLPPERVLLTSGAAEAFVLLARAVRARRPVVVHPQFTEPEAALRDAGHRVGRVLLAERDGFRLDPDAVPEDADLVVIGNPTNPTSVLHPAGALARLARPGRTLVVDEAFMDAVPGERESLAERTDLPGLVVLRSLTKTWGLAGLRVGYALAAPETVGALQQAQPLWPVSGPALAAAEACSAPGALAEAAAAAEQIAVDRAHLLARLGEFGQVRAAGPAAAPFVLIQLSEAAAVRRALRTHGFAVRRGDTFPGLGPDWLRLAVRDRATTDRFAAALAEVLGGSR